jgi:hypothetical protein
MTDDRPRGPETNKCVDGPHPGLPPTCNPNEFRTEAEAQTEVERLRQEDPAGNYLVVKASPYGDLWIVARRGELSQVIDMARGNQQPSEQEW